MSEIGVIDYGAGNIASVMKAIDYAGADPKLVGTAEEILACDKLVLPGVGAAGQAIEALRNKELEEPLREAVFNKGIPFMGICVGMQLLAEDMYEYGHHKGLGWIPGKVISLPDAGITNKVVPNMGWRDVEFKDNINSLESRLGNRKAFYFCHSYTLLTEDKYVCCTVDYEEKLVAGIAFDNICAFQFHPEKSQLPGDHLMQWFIDWKP